MAGSPWEWWAEAGLGTGSVHILSNEPAANLSWEGAGAPRNRLRFEGPTRADGHGGSRVSAQTASGRAATITSCTPGPVINDAAGRSCLLDGATHGSVSFSLPPG